MAFVGCHISIRHGYLAAAQTAHRLNAKTYQFFPKNPQSLTVKSFDRRDAESCADFCHVHGIRSIIHTTYATNIGVSDTQLRQATIASIRNDLDIAETCGAIGVVVHFGKAKEKDPLQGYRNIIQCLNETLDDWRGSAKLLLENQAGQGTRMGMTFTELARIRTMTDAPDHIGFCLDTCHLFAGGVYTGRNWAELLQEGRELGYFDHLAALHLNDSVYGTGSYRDRHANVGRGEMGVSALLPPMRTAVGLGIPLILETAAGPDGTHREEMALVHRLLQEE